MSRPTKLLLAFAAGAAVGSAILRRRLRPAVGQKMDQVQDQMDQLKAAYEQQDRMRRDFTANVSQELKTPLTSISGYAEIIREGMVRSEDVSRFAGKIYEEAQRLMTLVEDILNLSHLDEGAPGQERCQGIDLYALCQRALASLDEQHAQYQILFLDASDDVLERRYKETRRRHPISLSMGLSTSDAIREERRILRPMYERANYIVDTSLLTTAKHKARI